MLRALVLLLLIANLGYWAWSAGHLGTFGVAPLSQRDPARAALQVHPDSVRVLAAPQAAASAASAASAPPAALAADADSAAALVCLEAGPFAPDTLGAAERTLANHLPAGGWVRFERSVPAQYGVLLGPFSARETQQKKGAELGRLRLSFETVPLTADSPARALVLGRYRSRGAAEAALERFKERGVSTAQVMTLREAGNGVSLRVDKAAPDVAAKLLALGAATLGAEFTPCPEPSAAP